ncbi:MAG TPA: hypothetical protein VE978_01035 [Chitinophagales bacterium]|nr:hypothetical protein [Chitinophagales bacterium]
MQITPLTLKQVVENCTGTYQTTRLCTWGSMVSGYVHDTTYNVQLSVTSLYDTILFIEGHRLDFSGNLDSNNYFFYYPASGGGASATIDSTFNSIQFGYWDGGLGGGSGCNYSGHK